MQTFKFFLCLIAFTTLFYSCEPEKLSSEVQTTNYSTDTGTDNPDPGGEDDDEISGSRDD